MKKVILCLLALAGFGFAVSVFAASGTGIGSVASTVGKNLGDIAKLITGAAYVAGMAFVVGAIVKFKAHKDNPTQVTIGNPIAMLFIGAALIFAPSVFKVSGGTLFTSGVKGTVSGVSSF